MHIYPNVSATASAYLSFNGAPPPHLLSVAEAIDRGQRPAPPASTHSRIGRIRVHRQVLIDMMVASMIAAAERSSAITEDDLRRDGFLDADIAAHAAEAYTRACAERPHIAQLALAA